MKFFKFIFLFLSFFISIYGKTWTDCSREFEPVEILAQTVTVPSPAEIDYKVEFREAKATLIAATQFFVSLVPPLKEDVKAKVLMANLANRISFKAADPESAHILSETFGKKKVFRGKANGIAHYD